MRSWAVTLVGIALVMLVARDACAQEPGHATPVRAGAGDISAMQFSFTPRTPGQASWEIDLSSDQSGSYRERVPDAASQPLHVSADVWKQLLAGAAAVRSGHCETRTKGIAQTGSKLFSVVLGTSAPVSCTFNYSDDESLNRAANVFLAVAETVQQGAKLLRDRRFDRLALDADMEMLVEDVASGRAAEPGNIAPVLQAIVGDDRVIDRVRRKAARLLQAAGSAGPAVAQP